MLTSVVGIFIVFVVACMISCALFCLSLFLKGMEAEEWLSDFRLQRQVHRPDWQGSPHSLTACAALCCCSAGGFTPEQCIFMCALACGHSCILFLSLTLALCLCASLSPCFCFSVTISPSLSLSVSPCLRVFFSVQISAFEYMPTEEDIVLARIRTTGIREERLKVVSIHMCLYVCLYMTCVCE